MRTMASRWMGAVLVLGGAVLAGPEGPSRAAADEPRLAEYFGFQPLEIYKLDPRINNLLVRDLDGDKVADVAVVNNGRSRIDLLLSAKGGDAAGAAEKSEANQVPSDR